MNQIIKNLLESIYFEDIKTEFNCSLGFRLGKDISSKEDILQLYNDGLITTEDIFDCKLNAMELDEKTTVFFDEHIERYTLENYFPTEKNIGHGAWIKIKTNNGYQIHYAKKSTRKVNLEKKLEQYKSYCNKGLIHKSVKDIQHLLNSLYDYSIKYQLGLPLYEVFYFRTKTQKVYLEPYQYEMANIDHHIEYVRQSVKHIKTRNLYTAQNKEKIFYLQSRGIPKDVAIIMSNLNQCYFDVNMESAWGEFNELWDHSKTKIDNFQKKEQLVF